jgi:hypothetical protein
MDRQAAVMAFVKIRKFMNEEQWEEYVDQMCAGPNAEHIREYMTEADKEFESLDRMRRNEMDNLVGLGRRDPEIDIATYAEN